MDQMIAKRQEVIHLIRNDQYTGPTSGMAQGYAQANLVVLPEERAYDFLLFCQRNPKPCPVLEVTDTGSYEARDLAPGSDLRTDLPKYRIYRKGLLEQEVTNVLPYWDEQLVAFLLGCSFTFETVLMDAGVPIRHIDQSVNVPIFTTDIDCVPAGSFEGKMVVSMRPIPLSCLTKTIQITARFPSVHGAPVHIGSPEKIGIRDINQPDFGEPVPIYEEEVPVFWACGVTPQVVLLNNKTEFVITHAPGHMFITQKRDIDFMVY